MPDRTIPYYNIIMKCEKPHAATPVLPEGFRFHMYRDGDEKDWAWLEYEIGDFSSTAEAEQYFLSSYRGHSRLDIRERCVFVLDECGRFVGSCIAWKDIRRSAPVASLHWLVTAPGHQGRGIGKALCQRVMQIFSAHGEFPVYLHTQPWSWKAVLLYAGQGFRLQRTDTFSHYENQFDQAREVLKDILTAEQYRCLMEKTTAAETEREDSIS